MENNKKPQSIESIESKEDEDWTKAMIEKCDQALKTDISQNDLDCVLKHLK